MSDKSASAEAVEIINESDLTPTATLKYAGSSDDPDEPKYAKYADVNLEDTAKISGSLVQELASGGIVVGAIMPWAKRQKQGASVTSENPITSPGDPTDWVRIWFKRMEIDAQQISLE